MCKPVKIKLTKNMFALIDKKDFEKVSKRKWFTQKSIHTSYAASDQRNKDGSRNYTYMHRFILNVLDTNVVVDHIDGNGLNNSRKNLRICSKLNNSQNSRKRANSSSKFKGVRIHKSTYKNSIYMGWRAVIKVNKKYVSLGLFPYNEEGEVLAASAYDEAAKKYFGEFAKTNFDIYGKKL